MMRDNRTTFEELNRELEDLLEDVLTQIQELREEFTSALDDMEDRITSMNGVCEIISVI